LHTKLAAAAVKAALQKLADPKRAATSAGFFQAGPGQYGAGDRFLGIRVPEQRRVARQFKNLTLPEVARLLASEFHEHRFTALEILVAQFEKADAAQREAVFRFYLRNMARINNWDLVDTSARYIVGEYLRHRSRKPVYRLARSPNMWERRIAMVSTQAWIGDADTADAYALAAMLLEDKQDLIQKAVGWMLREAGMHSKASLLQFIGTMRACHAPRCVTRSNTSSPPSANEFSRESCHRPESRRVLGAIDSCDKAAMLGVMDVQIVDARVCQQSLQAWRQLGIYRKIGIDQRSRSVECTYRQGSILHDLGNLVSCEARVVGILAHVNGKA
jgi:3-methyladenine DNA glycosylase AlkD